MKKKLLSILLSLAMIFTLVPVATCVALADDKEGAQANLTVADILPSYFPETNDPTQPPIDSWINNNSKLCISENKLSFTGNGHYYCSLETIENIQVSLSENSYNAIFRSYNRFGDSTKQYEISVVFNMDSEKPTSICVSGFEKADVGYGTTYLLNGTYKPKTIADILPWDFPKEEQAGWINPDNKSTLYLSSDSSNLLHSSHSQGFNIPTSTNVFLESSRIKARGLDYDLEFAFENDELSEIKITGYNQKYSSKNVDGVYIPGKILNDIMPNNFPESIEDAWKNDQEVKLYCCDYNSFALSSDTSPLINDKVFNDICNMTIFPVLNQQHQYELSVDDVLFKFKLNGSGRIKSISIEGFQGEDTILNGTFTGPPTICDIMPDRFPTMTGDSIPENSWKNEGDKSLFLLEQFLIFVDPQNMYDAVLLSVEQNLSKSGNNYCTAAAEGLFSVTFNMDGDKFYSVDVNFMDPMYEEYEYYSSFRVLTGTYSTSATVTFNMNNHGTNINPVSVKTGSMVTEPDIPTADGYTFGGWYKDAECTQAWNFGADIVTKDITLYAKWIEKNVPLYAIAGNVTEGEEPSLINVPNATVELFVGKIKVKAEITDGDGRYSFNNVEKGIYNIVVTKIDGKTKTQMVPISDSSVTVNVNLPTSKINSKVEYNVREIPNVKSDISMTVVGGLDSIAEKNKPEKDGDKVTIKLTVEPKEDIDNPEQQEIKSEAGKGKKVEFLDLSLVMQTNDDKPVDIGNQNDELLTIIIPFKFSNVDVTSVMILRNHGGQTEKLTTTPNENGENVEINEKAGNIILHVMKFSVYAIAYDESEGAYTITNNAPRDSKEENHGYIEVSGNASSGYKVTVIVHPNKGYKLENLTYTPSGGEAQNITLTKSFTMPDKEVTVDATFKKGSWDPIIPIRPIVPVEKYYAVHFDMQGIGSAIADVKVKAGACVAMPTTPVAEGYVFGGWYKEASCINAWNFAADTVTKDTTLYAKWTSKDDITSGLVKAAEVNLTRATAYKNGKIKLTFKNLKLENGVKVVNYQVYRSTSKKFNKNLKKANIKRTADTKNYTWTNVNKLKKGTKYYYKVRGKVQLSDGTYVYTKWSNIKSAKCKKTR